MIDSDSLAKTIQGQIAGTVERSIEDYVQNIVRTLAMDQDWIAKMEMQINQEITRKFSQKFSTVDVNSLVNEAIAPAVERYFQQRRTAGHGLVDLGQETELTIMPGAVVAENQLAATSLKIEQDAEISRTLTVRDLAVKGTVNIDNSSWQALSKGISKQVTDEITADWRDSLIASVTSSIKQTGIDFEHVNVAGKPLISNDTLAATILRSSLTQVGTLDSLRVAGAADLGGSLAVRSNRVGINTEHPDMALAVWDEEVALVLGKHREQTAYVGTLRPQRLIIGINRSPAIDIDEQGRVSVKHLTVGRHRMCHEPECPNYSGTKGDIVFNSDPKNDGIWGWQCLGAFRWIPLRTA